MFLSGAFPPVADGRLRLAGPARDPARPRAVRRGRDDPRGDAREQPATSAAVKVASWPACLRWSCREVPAWSSRTGGPATSGGGTEQGSHEGPPGGHVVGGNGRDLPLAHRGRDLVAGEGATGGTGAREARPGRARRSIRRGPARRCRSGTRPGAARRGAGPSRDGRPPTPKPLEPAIRT
jgi:hypothetical protein